MLAIESLRAGYGGVLALHGVSLEVKEGEIVGIVGSNGAGKSTLLRTISGIVHTIDGKITFLGERIDNLPSHEIVRRGIVQVPEGRHLFSKQTVLENLRLGAYMLRNPRQIQENLDQVYEVFPLLKERANQRADTLSGGQQQMLALGRGLMSRPRLLMIDECSLGVMPTLVEEIFRVIKRINEAGVTVLLVEQKVQEALDLAHRAYVLQTGRIVLQGTGQELLCSELVQRAYLGM